LTVSDTETAVVVVFVTKLVRGKSANAAAATVAALGGGDTGVPVARELATVAAPETTKSGRSPEVPGSLPDACRIPMADAAEEKVTVVVKTAGTPLITSEEDGHRRPVVELLETVTPMEGIDARP